MLKGSEVGNPGLLMDIRDLSFLFLPAPQSYYVTCIPSVSWHNMAAEAPAITSTFQAARVGVGASNAKGVSH